MADSVTVVGAGPAGSFSAYLLAKAGFDVRVLEEHKTIGEPVACTGVIAADVLSQMKQLRLPKELIVNKIAKARIIAPSRELIEIKLKNDIIIDRAGFDRHIAEMAREAGARFFVSHRFESLEYDNGSKDKKIIAGVKDNAKNEIKKIETDYLIGADGPSSTVAKAAGLFGSREFYTGIQVTIPFANDNAINFYPSEDGIAWIVPENEEVARVGIAARKEAGSYFRKFITAVAGEGYEKKIIGWQAGPILVYNPRLKSQTKDRKVLLVGDAAAMVKATTLGGINQSLMAAEAVAESVTKDYDYEKLWKKRIGRDLWLSLQMRKAMERFSNQDYNSLIAMFRKEKNRQLLEKYDRDEPSKFALKLLLGEPRLLLLARKAFF